MSSIVTIDLTKNPDIAALVADMAPGAKVYGCFTVKTRDDQTLTLRISEMTDKKEDLPEPGAPDEDDEDGEAAADGIDTESEETTEKAAEKPGASLAKKLTADSNPGY